MKSSIWVSGAAVLLLVTFCAYGGTLRIGQPQVQGEEVTVPVLLEGDVAEGVASLSFQLNYDPAAVEPQLASPGTAAQSAGKNVTANVKEPGTYMVVMSGLNSNTIASGEVTNIVLQRRGDEASTNISITGTALASLEADEIPSRGSTGNISFEATNEEEDEEDAEEEPDASDDEETPASETTAEERSTADRVPLDAGNTDSTAPGTSNTVDSSQANSALANAGQPAMAETPDSETDTDAGKKFAEALTAAATSRSNLDTPLSGLREDEDNVAKSRDAAASTPASEMQMAAITEETSPPETEHQDPAATESAAPADTETSPAAAPVPSAEKPSPELGESETPLEENADAPTMNPTSTLIFLIVVVVVLAGMLFLRRRLFS